MSQDCDCVEAEFANSVLSLGELRRGTTFEEYQKMWRDNDRAQRQVAIDLRKVQNEEEKIVAELLKDCPFQVISQLPSVPSLKNCLPRFTKLDRADYWEKNKTVLYGEWEKKKIDLMDSIIKSKDESARHLAQLEKEKVEEGECKREYRAMIEACSTVDELLEYL